MNGWILLIFICLSCFGLGVGSGLLIARTQVKKVMEELISFTEDEKEYISQESKRILRD